MSTLLPSPRLDSAGAIAVHIEEDTNRAGEERLLVDLRDKEAVNIVLKQIGGGDISVVRIHLICRGIITERTGAAIIQNDLVERIGAHGEIADVLIYGCGSSRLAIAEVKSAKL